MLWLHDYPLSPDCPEGQSRRQIHTIRINANKNTPKNTTVNTITVVVMASSSEAR